MEGWTWAPIPLCGFAVVSLGAAVEGCGCGEVLESVVPGSEKRLLVLERVGVIGEPPLSTVGEVGEVTVSDPCEESLVRFFLRKPSDGMREDEARRLEGRQGGSAGANFVGAVMLA